MRGCADRRLAGCKHFVVPQAFANTAATDMMGVERPRSRIPRTGGTGAVAFVTHMSVTDNQPLAPMLDIGVWGHSPTRWSVGTAKGRLWRRGSAGLGCHPDWSRRDS